VGPWATVIVTAASVAGVFFTVMAFRGLIEGVEGFSGRCADCHRATMLPLPVSHRCWQCRHQRLVLRRSAHRHAG